MKYVEIYHPEEQIIGNRDEGVQTQRRITITPKRKVIALLSMIEPETFVEASKDPHWVKAMEEECPKLRRKRHGSWYLVQGQKHNRNQMGVQK